MKQQESLDNPHALQPFQAKILATLLAEYVDFKQSAAVKLKTMSKVIDLFIGTEREYNIALKGSRAREVKKFWRSLP